MTLQYILFDDFELIKQNHILEHLVYFDKIMHYYLMENFHIFQDNKFFEYQLYYMQLNIFLLK